MANRQVGKDDADEHELQDLLPGQAHSDHANLEAEVVGKALEVGKKATNAGAPQAPQPEAAIPMVFGMPLKWVSLVALICQTTLQVFVIKFARAGGTHYLNSTCVFFAELLKTVTSFVLLSRETGGVVNAVTLLRDRFLGDPFESSKVAVPAFAYIIQNTLIFYSLDKLSMAVQQVTYQLKILTAALMGVILLGKKLNATKWGSLFLLVVGVAIVQAPRGQTTAGSSSASGSVSDGLLGFVAVLIACFMSGFAGAYMEKILKHSPDSLWLRNFQLGIFGSAIGIISAIVQNPERIIDGGFVQGYTWRVLLAIATLGFGGLLVAVVLKYADNILRQFSTALSIILTSIISWAVLGEYEPDSFFFLGTVLVIIATFIYNLGLPEIVTSAFAGGTEEIGTGGDSTVAPKV